MHGVGRDVVQGFEDEPSLGHSRVRHGEAGLVDDLIVVEQQIEVEGARAPPFSPFAPRGSFDAAQVFEQVEGSKGCVECGGGVEERPLPRRPDRGGFVDG